MRSLAQTLSRLVEGESRSSNGLKYGTVHEVDAGKQQMRMKLGGTDAKPYLSPWLPYGQTAGALKVHTPPSKGQQFALLSADGDFRRGVAIPLTWSDDNKSPSEKGDEHVVTFGDAKVELRGKDIAVTVPKLVIKCGESTFTLTGDGLKMVASDYQFD